MSDEVQINTCEDQVDQSTKTMDINDASKTNHLIKIPFDIEENEGVINSEETIQNNIDDSNENISDSDEIENSLINDVIKHPIIIKEIFDQPDSKMSKTDIQEYQIGVKIYEARKLPGINIDPVAHIRIGDKKKSTSVQKCNNNPYFMEYFAFTFKESHIQLMNKPIELIVKHSKGALQTDETIGSFSLDVGCVYKQPNHEFVKKWAPLTDPHNFEPKGYLKVDLSVISKEDLHSGTSEKKTWVKHKAEETKEEAKEENEDDSEDEIEDNLLLPLNITSRQFVKIIIKIYKADGLPRSGSSVSGALKSFTSGSKETLNPYVVVNFAGVEGKTSVIKKTCSPIWNQQITFLDSFPSLFQSIIFQLKDESIGDDNIIATYRLPLNKISTDDENGFLPVFGPSFLHFYGAPRENDDLKYLNLGLEDGVAYRGRLLIKIVTEFVDLIDHDLERVSVQNIKEIDEETLGLKKEFLLYGKIEESTMVLPKYADKSLSYEISLGDPDDIDGDGKVDDSDKHAKKNFNGISNSIKPVECFANRKSGSYYLPITQNPLSMFLKFHCIDACQRIYNSNRLFKISKEIDTGLADVEAIRVINEIDASRRLLGVIICAEEKLQEYLKYLHSKEPLGKSDLDKGKVSIYRTLTEILINELSTLRSIISKTNMNEIIQNVDILAGKIETMSEDVETSFPDIFIFLIYSGKRIAYARLPVKDFLYSQNLSESGIYCNRNINILLRSIDKINKIRNKIKIRIWFGYVDKNDLIIQKLFEKNSLDIHQFKFCAHIFQARCLIATDKSGLSDPYVKLHFANSVLTTHYVRESLSPIWNEILISNIVFYGEKEEIKSSQYNVLLEVYDHDKMGTDEFMGRCLVNFNTIRFSSDSYISPKLLWFDIWKDGESSGQILAAFELFQINEDDPDEYPKSLPPARLISYDKVQIISIPDCIKPTLSIYRLQVLFWGLRSIKKACVDKPRIDIECNGQILSSTIINDFGKNLNFPKALKEIVVDLPDQEFYCPPLTISLMDCKSFGRSTLIGSHIVNSVSKYMSNDNNNNDINEKTQFTLQPKNLIFIKHSENNNNKKESKRLPEGIVTISFEKETNDLDWWSRYYSSKSKKTRKSNINNIHENMIFKFYNHEIEKSKEFFKDKSRLHSFPLCKGKTKKSRKKGPLGVFKGAIHLKKYTSLESSPLEYFPDNNPVFLFVRIYLIRAIDIKPTDINGKADLFPVIYTNKQKISDKDNYIPNQLNPIFGRVYELEVKLPEESILWIALKDKDVIGSNDLIGFTEIDLEERFYSAHHFTCGLPKFYETSGPNKWRDYLKPTQLLTKICRDLKKVPLIITRKSINVGNKLFNLDINCEYASEVTEEHLACGVLNSWKEAFGTSLVPEHVETRSLYHPDKPGIRQGKIELWVDIFRADCIRPPAIDIRPRMPKSYELRIIIYNTKDVILDDNNPLSGEKMSDIYVKGWLEDPKLSQQTDVHYRSLTGEGNFNWRFVFRFNYLFAEDMIIIKRKDGLFSIDETEYKVPCKLILQIWDFDSFSGDDFLGCLPLSLKNFPRGARNAKTCDLSIINNEANKNGTKVNLFKEKRLRGWWPFYAINEETKETELTGKIEAEFELLSQEDADLNPVGLGRSEPNPLEKPNRPDTSFLWFVNPLKSFKYILWSKHKWMFIKFILFIILILFLALFVYSLPGYTVKKILGA